MWRFCLGRSEYPREVHRLGCVWRFFCEGSCHAIYVLVDVVKGEWYPGGGRRCIGLCCGVMGWRWLRHGIDFVYDVLRLFHLRL